LVDRKAGVLADLDLPILIEPAQVAMAGALRERLAVLDDRLLNLFGQSRAITPAEGGVKPKSSKIGTIRP